MPCFSIPSNWIIANLPKKLCVFMKLHILSVLLLCCVGCNSNQLVNEVDSSNFSVWEDRLLLDVKIDSTVLKDCLFDTGCLVGCLIPETASYVTSSGQSIEYNINGLGKIPADSVFIAGFPYNYGSISVVKNDIIPMIAPKYVEDSRIWHFNLDSLKFYIDDECYLVESSIVIPIKFVERNGKRLAPMVNIPMRFSHNGVSLDTDYYYFLDTGTPYGFVMTDPTPEMLSFVSSISARNYIDEYSGKVPNRNICQFEIDCTLNDIVIKNLKCEFDTGLRSYDTELGGKFNHGNKAVVGTIGMRFLKHFNFDIDLQNCRLVLYQNSSYFPSRLDNLNQFWCNDSGMVRRICMESQAYINGLRVGDKIDKLNGRNISEMSLAERDSLIYMCSTLELSLSNGIYINLH